nr:hypothetical protein [Mycolicibacterium sarraceniae]
MTGLSGAAAGAKGQAGGDGGTGGIGGLVVTAVLVGWPWVRVARAATVTAVTVGPAVAAGRAAPVDEAVMVMPPLLMAVTAVTAAPVVPPVSAGPGCGRWDRSHRGSHRCHRRQRRVR